jgi:hypothetical protein
MARDLWPGWQSGVQHSADEAHESFSVTCSTPGEQLIHVSQPMSGLIFSPPGDGADRGPCDMRAVDERESFWLRKSMAFLLFVSNFFSSAPSVLVQRQR